jgi:hypothetical protein
MPRTFDDVAECVESTLARVGPRIVLALPLGIGKPNPLVNEFYRRAQADPAIKLKIFTALSLRAPQWHGDLERRFLQPLVERLFGNDVPLEYLRDLHENAVPENVEVVEFFLDPGSLLHIAHSQRHYVSTNYTHVARDVAAHGVNVIAQLVAKRSVEGRAEFSLGSIRMSRSICRTVGAAARRGQRWWSSVVLARCRSCSIPRPSPPTVLISGRTSRYDYDLFAPPNRALQAPITQSACMRAAGA